MRQRINNGLICDWLTDWVLFRIDRWGWNNVQKQKHIVATVITLLQVQVCKTESQGKMCSLRERRECIPVIHTRGSHYDVGYDIVSISFLVKFVHTSYFAIICLIFKLLQYQRYQILINYSSDVRCFATGVFILVLLWICIKKTNHISTSLICLQIFTETITFLYL